MRLYPKKLNSLSDLEKEKALLQKQMRELDKEDIFSIEGITGGTKAGKKKKDEDEKEAGGDIVELLLGLLPISNPLVSMGLKLVGNRLMGSAGKSSKKKKQGRYDQEEEAPHKSIIKKVAFEFISGYLKWKAIELSYKGIKHLINKRKENKPPADPYAA